MKQYSNPTRRAWVSLILLALCSLTGIAHGADIPDQWRNEIPATMVQALNPQASEVATIPMVLGINIALLAVTAHLLLRLRRSNRKLESLAETQRIGQMGSWELNLASGVLTWSEEIYRIFEIDPLRFPVTYDAFMNAIHPDDREEVNKAYRESLENRTSYFIEHRLLFADGRIKYVRECCETFYRADGKPVRSVGTVQDISERKRLEAELVQREREFRTLAENSPDIIVRYDSECRYVYANPVFEKKSGFRLDELRGKMPAQVPGLPEADFYQQRVLKVVETGLPVEFEHSTQDRERNANWRLVSIFPELDTGGRVAHVQMLSRNITALKETERHLEESRGRLRQLLAHQENNREEERKKLAVDMHEDLLQILSAMQMNGKLLQSNSGGMPAHITKTLPSLISGLGKSINLVRDMVVSLRPTVLNLGIDPALEWLADEFAKRHPGKVCKLTCADVEQMEEKSSLLIFRIVQEALEAAENIAGTSNVNIALHREEGGYLLTIRSEDVGYSLDVNAVNFLNLSGLQERVIAMGGEMVIFSEGDYGLVIQAKLPLQDAG